MSTRPLTQAGTFHLSAARARVFPLFTVLGEREWAANWDPVLLSGVEERGTAFRTRDQSGRESVWIVTEYRPSEGRVSYARLVEGSNIGLVDVICTEAADGGTDVSVRYTLTALSEGVRPDVCAFLNAGRYSQMIDEWRVATSAVLTRAAATA